MTLPQNVEDALNFFYRDEAPSDEESWLKVIRAELHRLTAMAEGVDDMVVRLGEVTEELERLRAWNERVSVCRDHAANAVDGECLICRLEAANALLREIYAGDDLEQPARRNEALDRIQSHLQGAGDE